jgi:phospholipid transport system substrate-binding protein
MDRSSNDRRRARRGRRDGPQRIIKANGEPVQVDYLMHRNGQIWLISDIYLDSAISEIATRRSEFAAILRKDGIDGLIAALNRKADMLSATTAKAF